MHINMNDFQVLNIICKVIFEIVIKIVIIINTYVYYIPCYIILPYYINLHT